MSPVVKYIVRAVKYFFYFSIIMTLILTALVCAGIVEGSIETMFKDGYRSLVQIAIMFGCVAAVYPIFGFVRKDASIAGEYQSIRGTIVEFMEEHGYVLEKEEDENLSFRSRSIVKRILRMYEDRITLTRNLGGYEVEGLRKDTIRLIYGLENRFRSNDEDC